MIDAGPSLKAAEGLRATDLLTYLVGNGWSARPSRVDGMSILSKDIPGADRAAVFILPVKPGFDEEQRRVADALRTIEAIEERPISTIVDEVRQVAAQGVKKQRGKALPLAKKKRPPLRNRRAS
jgi:hypothetical protein